MGPPLPPEYDDAIYAELHPDLRAMTPDERRAHHGSRGVAEGRRAHALPDREAFAALVPAEADALEIGPFFNPLLRGPRVRYFDVIDREAMIARATEAYLPTERIPERIHYLSAVGDLSIVDATFDAVLSSHAVEHQPDLVAHLRQVERLLRPGGRYLLLVPDHRYCFDHFLSPSTIGQILEAHVGRRTLHTLGRQLEHQALTTHNDARLHWAGDHGAPEDGPAKLRQILDRFSADPGRYWDVHAWYFTPESFATNLGLLRALGLVSLQPVRVYPTLRDTLEFWAVLERP